MLENNKKAFSTKTIVQIGLMAALVFVGTMFRIKIPAGIDGTMLHLGNVFCLLSGLLFGGVPGGLAAGFGSAIFDLTSEYASEFWITFINKFFMGFVAGLVAHWGKNGVKNEKLQSLVGAVCGSATYVMLYLCKTIIWQRFVYGVDWNAVWPVVGVKATTSIVNGVIAVVVSVILALALRPALRSARLLPPQDT